MKATRYWQVEWEKSREISTDEGKSGDNGKWHGMCFCAAVTAHSPTYNALYWTSLNNWLSINVARAYAHVYVHSCRMRKCLSHQHVQVQLTALQRRHCAYATATTIIRQQTFLEPDKSSHVAHSTVAIDTNNGVCLRFSEQGSADRQTDLW
jgi:hypothetical protein